MVLAEANSKIVGYAVGSLVDRGEEQASAYCEMVFVSKNYRNRGIAKKLIKALVDYVRELECSQIYHYVAKWNKPMINASLSVGFSQAPSDIG